MNKFMHLCHNLLLKFMYVDFYNDLICFQPRSLIQWYRSCSLISVDKFEKGIKSWSSVFQLQLIVEQFLKSLYFKKILDIIIDI